MSTTVEQTAAAVGDLGTRVDQLTATVDQLRAAVGQQSQGVADLTRAATVDSRPEPARAGSGRGAAKKPEPSRVPPVRFSRLPGEGLACPICLGDAVRWVSVFPGLSRRFRSAVLLACEQCGSGYVPDADRILADYYRDEYARSNRKDRDSDPAEYFVTGPQTKLAFRRARAQVAMLEQVGARFDAVLDYGSGPGYLLFEAKPRRPYAVELDEHSHKYLDHLGVTRLEPDALGVERFDTIVASHVIEHFTSTTLDDALAGIVASLKIGGRILIEVPQGGHSYLEITRNQEPHTLFFTATGLLDTLQRAGLEVIEAKARTRSPHPRRTDPIFLPPPDTPFRDLDGGGLTVIATRSS